MPTAGGALAITLTCVISYLPDSIMHYYSTFTVDFALAKTNWDGYFMGMAIGGTTACINNINYCINFYIYCLTGKRYRKEAYRILFQSWSLKVLSRKATQDEKPIV